MISRSLTLACSRAAAFSAWTKTEEVKAWWGDDLSYRTIEWQADLQAGGKWRGLFASPDGETFSSCGTYIALENPGVLDWTWAADWNPSSVKQIAMRFVAERAGTRMTVTSEGHGSEQERSEDGQGWDQILGWLTHYISPSHE